MRCDQARREIGELGGGGQPRADLQRHIETCAACALDFGEQQRAIAAIKALPWPEPSPDLVARLKQPELLRPAAGLDHARRRASDLGIPDLDRDRPAPRGADRPRAWQAVRQRRWRWVEAAAAGLVLLVTGWLILQQRFAVPASSPPTLEGTATAPVSGATPAAAVTRIGDGAGWALTEFRGVAGRPIELLLDAGWERADDLRCRRVWAELGDGTVRELECHALPPDAYPAFPSDATYPITHTYATGTYFPQLRMARVDGAELVQTVAQVIIAPTPPRSYGAELARMRPLYWALGIIVLGLLWAKTRRARDRWLGLALALGAATVFGMLLISVLTPQTFGNLGALHGQAGLDPLDPASPLVDTYVQPLNVAGALMTTFSYMNGDERTYYVPVGQGRGPARKDGLGRLRTEHRELTGIPFADLGRDGVGLGVPARMSVYTAADNRPEAAQSWLRANCARRGNLVPAPDGSAFLVALPSADEQTTSIWFVPRSENPDLPDRMVASNAYDYLWSPDSRFMVLVKPFAAPSGDVSQPSSQDVGTRLVLHEVATGEERAVAVVDALARPGVTAEGVWYAQADGIWVAPWAGGEARRVMAWPAERPFAPVTFDRHSDDPEFDAADTALIRPDPNGRRVAYSCRGGLCFSNVDGGGQAVAALPPSDAAWSPDGQAIAAIEPDYRYPNLTLIERDGGVRAATQIAPDGRVSPPRWTADGRRIFLTTCPLDGRRIITVEAETGAVRDLSQPRWDAWSALLPDENALLLSNGRGGYWRAPIRDPGGPEER